MSKPRKGVLGETVDKLEVIANNLEGAKEGIWIVAMQLDKLNEQLEEFFKHVQEKGLTWRTK